MSAVHQHGEAMAIHAMRRFKQRCGAELPRVEYDRMNEAIRAGRVTHAAFTKDGTRVFKVRFAAKTGYAAWNPKLRQIGTFYPDLSWVTAKGGTAAVSWAGLVPA